MNRPKRRRYKDNPYILNYDNENNMYNITFKNNNEIVSLNVSKEVYDVFNNAELRDLSEMNEFDNHIEHLELDENSLFKRSFNKEVSTLDLIMKSTNIELLNKAIEALPLVQKRRLKMYFFDGLNTYEIGKLENCSHQAINKSLTLALKELKENLKNLNF